MIWMVTEDKRELTRITDKSPGELFGPIWAAQTPKQFTYYTSNHRRSGTLPGAVSISLKDPPGSTVNVYEKNGVRVLAPTKDLLKEWYRGGMTPEQYTIKYYQQTLSKLDAHEVLNDLKKFAGPDGRIIMLCWEPPGAFCHRRLAAEWLIRGNPGLQITEL